MLKPSLEHQHVPKMVLHVGLARLMRCPQRPDRLGLEIALLSQTRWVQKLLSPAAGGPRSQESMGTPNPAFGLSTRDAGTYRLRIWRSGHLDWPSRSLYSSGRRQASSTTR